MEPICIIAILLGLLVLGALYCGTMALYFFIRKRHPSPKILIEILLSGGAFTIALVCKLVVVWKLNADLFTGGSWELIGFILTGVYATIGGLGFEGLPESVDALVNSFLSVVYTGSAIYAALVVVSLIGARASYELYSFFRLFAPERHADIYVFTALNEESITLAESIDRDVKEENHAIKEANRAAKKTGSSARKKKRKAKIVFAGPSLDPFDRAEELCRRVMMNGFLYWSYAKPNRSTADVTRSEQSPGKSIARILHLNNHNINEIKRDFFVFAFDAVDHVPQEEDNLDAVLEDIEARRAARDVRRKKRSVVKAVKRADAAEKAFAEAENAVKEKEAELRAKKDLSKMETEQALSPLKEAALAAKTACHEAKQRAEALLRGWDDLRIEYFILTKRKINYQAYQTVIDRYTEKGAEFAIIHLWNEAHEVAKNAVGKIMVNGFVDELSERKDKEGATGVYVWALGFGGTGEALANELFAETPGISKGCSRPFAMNIFDSNMAEAGEVFRAEHKHYLFLEDPTWRDLVERANAESAEKKGFPAPVYGFHALRTPSEETGTTAKNELYEMKADILGESAVAPDVIAISTGDDYRNITYANTITQWIVDKRGLYRKKLKDEKKAAEAAGKEWTAPKGPDEGIRFVLVSIFDEDNNHLLSSYGCAEGQDPRVITVCDEGTPYLKIIIVNNLEDVYSFKGYKQNAKAAVLKNMTYDQLSREENALSNPLIALSNALSVGGTYAEEGARFEAAVSEIMEKYRAAYGTRLAQGASGAEKTVVERVNALLLESRALARQAALEHQEAVPDPTTAYNKLALWRRESNRGVVDAEPFYSKYFRKKAVELLDKYEKPSDIPAEEMFRWKEHAASVEHDRWVRLHLSDGWINAGRADACRHHDCITSYEDLKKEKAYTIVYDVMNVLWAMSDDGLFKE